MMQVERLNERTHSLDGPGLERAPLSWTLEASARAAEREAERAERAKLIEALSLIARAWETEKAEWKAEAEKLQRQAADALADSTRAASEARAAAARASEARENDRVLYQTDRTSWANERRQLQKTIDALKKEAARGWLSRLVRGAGTI